MEVKYSKVENKHKEFIAPEIRQIKASQFLTLGAEALTYKNEGNFVEEGLSKNDLLRGKSLLSYLNY